MMMPSACVRAIIHPAIHRNTVGAAIGMAIKFYALDTFSHRHGVVRKADGPAVTTIHLKAFSRGNSLAASQCKYSQQRRDAPNRKFRVSNTHNTTPQYKYSTIAESL